MVKKSIKIELELILPIHVDEHNVLDELEDYLVDDSLVESYTLNLTEKQSHVVYDYDAIKDEN
jgi:hypothetical protein